MDPISLSVIGSLFAAIPLSIFAGQAPKMVAAGIQPALEELRRDLRQTEANAKAKAAAELVIAVVTAKEVSPQDEAMTSQMLDPLDWPRILAENAKENGLPMGGASALSVQDVWPSQKLLVTRGEQLTLRALFAKDDKREYALAVRRLVHWQAGREAALKG